ncbi:unnamed protein product [Phytomonas sp. Hart1]|nr:unnamed protein product [Phytomonas sp. Hart1]|eukprot:CCW68004.1 unnamed protein product [Phytomonas sp. isolate Hart1]
MPHHCYAGAIQRLVNRSLVLLLLPVVLDDAQDDGTVKGPTFDSDSSGLRNSPGGTTTLPPTSMAVRAQLMFNPLLGVGLAIHCGFIPLEWALHLITLRPSFDSTASEQAVAGKDGVQDVNRVVTTQLLKLCEDIKGWFATLDAL